MPPQDGDWKKAWATGPLPRGYGDSLGRRARSVGPLSSLPPPLGDRGPARPASGSFIVDESGTVLAFDRNMERLTGWDSFDIVGRSSDVGAYDVADEHGVRAYHTQPLFEGELPRADASVRTKLTIARKDGAQLDVEALVTPLGGRGGRRVVEVQRVLARTGGPAADATADARDPLTRLPHAAEFHARLRDEFEDARSGGHALSVLLVDIDGLKTINEEHGQERGDLVLRQVAGILTASVRQSDLVSRLEQDDFGVLLVGAGRGDARHVGGRIRKAIESFSFSGPGREPVAVSASIGVSSFPADAEAPHELVRRAEDALNEARRLGRNRVWCYVRRPRVRVNMPVYFDGPAAQMLGTSRDLSNSGIFIETRDDLPAGMRVGLTFRLPGQFDPVKVIGRVARKVEPAGDGRRSLGLGIEFERYNDVDRWRLESFLHQAWEEGPQGSAP